MHVNHAIMARLADLLKLRDKFQRNYKHSTAFKASIQQIIKAVKKGITSVCPNKDTILATDWSRAGMGIHLTQKLCRCQEIKPN